MIDLTGALAGFFALSKRRSFEYDVRTKSSSGANCYVTARSLVQSTDAAMASCLTASRRRKPETNQLLRAQSRSSIPIFASLRSRANFLKFCPPMRKGRWAAEAKHWQLRLWKKRWFSFYDHVHHWMYSRASDFDEIRKEFFLTCTQVRVYKRK